MRITVLLTAKRAHPAPQGVRAEDRKPITTTCTGSSNNRSRASRKSRIEAEVLDDSGKRGERLFGDLAILPASAQSFKAEQSEAAVGLPAGVACPAAACAARPMRPGAQPRPLAWRRQKMLPLAGRRSGDHRIGQLDAAW